MMSFPGKPKCSRFFSALLVSILLCIATHSDDARRIEITAKRFEYAPNQIMLKKGQPVVLVLHSEDVAHSIVAKELNLKADIPKGREAEVRFTPQKSGDFIAKCGHFCGSGHGRMQLKIHVTD